ncbi:MAG: zf-HC2 domain-containing protein [Candidatus Zixiibacteriota bacterium]
MNCRKVRQFLWSYLDKDIDQKSKEEIESHLKECSKCAMDMAELGKLREIFSKTEVLKPSHDFNKKLLARIQTNSVTNKAVGLARPKPSFSWRWAFASLATGIVVVFLALFYQDIFNPQGSKPTISQTPVLTETQEEDQQDFVETKGYTRDTRFVMDNLRTTQLKRIEDYRLSQSDMSRFIMESIPSNQMQRRRSSNQFVMPVVSTRTVKEKSSF